MYAYTYDFEGWFVGRVNPQPNPRGTGCLMPPNATTEEPELISGFNPRWNGQEWQQVDATIRRDAIAAKAHAAALERNVFSKLQIRRALRELNQETVLDNLLASNPQFASDWYDAQEIDLADPMTAAALELVEIDINAVKLKIAGIE